MYETNPPSHLKSDSHFPPPSPPPIHTKAQLQYLLSSREFDAIPSVSYKEMSFNGPFSSITLVVRAHAERFATERYPNGLVGLEVDREARKQKAIDGRAKVMANYEKRVAEAAKQGKKRPKRPKESAILSSRVDEQDGGFAVHIFHSIVIPFVGYRRKNKPTRPISSALSSVTHHFVCNRCSPNSDRDAQFKIPTFPTHSALLEHALTAHT